MMNPSLERLDRAELDALKLRRLNRLIERCWATNPYYRDLWSDHGVPTGPLTSLADLAHFPIIDKEMLLADQAERSPYGRRLGVPPEQVWEITLSSGTSGRTQEVHAHTARDAHLRGLLHGLAFWWAGGGPGDILAHHVGVSNSASHGSFHRGFRAVGSMPYLMGYAGFEKRLALRDDFGVDVMYVMPSAMNGLTTLCLNQGQTPAERYPSLRSIVMSGEAWPVDFVTNMEEAWGAKVYEGYGASQTYGAFIMSNCERGAVVENGERGLLHFYEWAAELEVLNPETLAPVDSGEAGELVVTLFEKEASPLIRFRTRDKVVSRAGHSCPCGRCLNAIEAGTISRWDDMVKIKGENVFPNEVDEIVFARSDISEYQGHVSIGNAGRDVAAIQLEFKPGAGEDPVVVERLRSELKTKTNVSFDLIVVSPGTLPQWTTPDIKPRRWHDERQAGLAAGAAV
jgi:phenylacetate-CoA ligase